MADQPEVTIKTRIEAPSPKPGYRSSEFWLTLAALLLGTLLTCGVLGDGQAAEYGGAALATLGLLGYTYSRGQAKAQALALLAALAPPEAKIGDD